MMGDAIRTPRQSSLDTLLNPPQLGFAHTLLQNHNISPAEAADPHESAVPRLRCALVNGVKHMDTRRYAQISARFPEFRLKSTAFSPSLEGWKSDITVRASRV